VAKSSILKFASLLAPATQELQLVASRRTKNYPKVIHLLLYLISCMLSFLQDDPNISLNYLNALPGQKTLHSKLLIVVIIEIRKELLIV
jgi:hypothetical protein